ncbi:SMAD/FHA domain-containing protein [Pisolithus croceorrhizus]|nr:SMAD/FHA domain-containing protein [Pisolithus croceorrhizus]KAI6107250.1 SMAD/FHA domain-containing protein [Pisolithus croceorrhizus]KAI6162777.1 SMAD/FHA domain-containing protein [Pisolithus thermaeus]
MTLSSTSAMDGTAVMNNNANPTPVLMRSTTILGSFLRASRPRGVSTSATCPQQPQQPRQLSPVGLDTPASPSPSPSPSPPVPSPPSPVPPSNQRRRSLAPQALVIPPSNPLPTSSGLGISHILRRRRSIGGTNALSPTPVSPTSDIPPPPSVPGTTTSTANVAHMPNPVPQVKRGPSTTSSGSPPQTYRIRLVPHLDSRRTLRFEPITRDLKDDDPPLRIGRFTDRPGLNLAAQNALNSSKLAFKSKVVSRAHAEIWLESGRFFIRDTKSSSGTFLNHLRLAAAGHESRPFQLRDGDILQLGVDYQGGSEDIYKSVKIRVEVGREWQASANAFNMNAITQLKELGVGTDPLQPGETKGKKRPSKPNIPDCCICLFPVTIRQALFIAPCSHAFHYKCIRPLLEKHTTAFSCPLCRSFADLEEDVEVEPEVDGADEEDDREGAEARTAGVNQERVTQDGVGNVEWDVPHGPSSAPVEGSHNTHTHARDRDRMSHNHHRDNNHLSAPHSQPRDGAETEVETDMGHETHRLRRPRVTVRTEGHIVVPATSTSAPIPGATHSTGSAVPGIAPAQQRDTDEEMIDGDLEADLYADEPDPDSLADAWIRPVQPVQGDVESEGEDGAEGEGSRGGSLEGGVSVGMGMAVDPEGTVSNGKRKR